MSKSVVNCSATNQSKKQGTSARDERLCLSYPHVCYNIYIKEVIQLSMQKRQLCTATLHPLIKWIGGKTQLLVKLRSMMPKEYHTYFEPFAGGAALYGNICPKSAVINDINPRLINLYNAVKSDTDNLISLLDNLQNQFNSYPTQRERGLLL